VEFEEKNISEDQDARRELVETYKSTATPTVVWDDEVIVGFDKDRLQQLIDEKG
jgi:glutaredoxin